MVVKERGCHDTDPALSSALSVLVLALAPLGSFFQVSHTKYCRSHNLPSKFHQFTTFFKKRESRGLSPCSVTII